MMQTPEAVIEKDLNDIDDEEDERACLRKQQAQALAIDDICLRDLQQLLHKHDDQRTKGWVPGLRALRCVITLTERQDFAALSECDDFAAFQFGFAVAYDSPFASSHAERSARFVQGSEKTLLNAVDTLRKDLRRVLDEYSERVFQERSRSAWGAGHTLLCHLHLLLSRQDFYGLGRLVGFVHTKCGVEDESPLATWMPGPVGLSRCSVEEHFAIPDAEEQFTVLGDMRIAED